MLKLIRRVFLFLLILMITFIAFNIRKDVPITELKEKYTNEDSKFVNVQGMEVHYRDEGEGTPLLLIHGTASSLHTWDGWADTLKDHFRVLRPDMPGFGITGPNSDHNYSIGRYVEFVNDFLTEVKADSCYIAGNSLGGLIAWNYALHYPNNTKKMILIDASGHKFPEDPPSSLGFQMARKPVMRWAVRWLTPRYLVERSIKEVYADERKISDELVTRYYDMLRRKGNRKAFIERVNNETSQPTHKLPSIMVPTQIQWGLKDTWIPVSHAYAFHESLPNSFLVLYDELGHVPMEEDPKETVQDALEFLLNE